MSFTANSNLHTDIARTLRDQQHAARVFADNQFRLAPKHNFLFHVAFGINTAALRDNTLVQRYGQEINMLVKSVDLPNFSVQTEMLNQYNRKKVVQYQHKLQETSIKFHDDNMGLINQLWQNYYSYYYADPSAARVSGAYNRNATRNSNFILSNYGLDNGSTAPFFSYIKIYQMARHEYVMYQLWNPVITSWNHNKVSYSDHSTRDFDMKIMYEAVSYGVGEVLNGDPEGFAVTHYDLEGSSLMGINPDPSIIDPSFVSSLDVETLSPSILNAALTQITNAQNSQIQTGTTSATTGVLSGSPAQVTSGVQGVVFPVALASTNTSTVATNPKT